MSKSNNNNEQDLPELGLSAEHQEAILRLAKASFASADEAKNPDHKKKYIDRALTFSRILDSKGNQEAKELLKQHSNKELNVLFGICQICLTLNNKEKLKKELVTLTAKAEEFPELNLSIARIYLENEILASDKEEIIHGAMFLHSALKSHPQTSAEYLKNFPENLTKLHLLRGIRSLFDEEKDQESVDKIDSINFDMLQNILKKIQNSKPGLSPNSSSSQSLNQQPASKRVKR